MPVSHLTRRHGLIALAGACASGLQAAEPVPVLFPELPEPYRSVFEAMLAGIAERVPSERLALPANAESAPAVLSQRRPRVLIALGRTALRAALELQGGVEVVGGGVIGPSEADARATTLLALSPDPALLLQRLRQLLPGVKRVNAVHSRQSAWLMRGAQEAARQLKLELQLVEVDELRAALRQYQALLAQAGPQDAFWLPQDAVSVDESTVLPMLLQECWSRGLPLFSSALGHVRRGALFSLYPNNRELGRSLGAAAAALLAGSATAPRGARPLREVHAALNTRTAGHLGLQLDPPLQRSFELLLPER